MIPSVFVSSTIQDLHHLRDSVRDVIAELGYTPVMSEYGDIGYLPTASATESCYISVRQCQLAVMIIGKRYGSVGEDGISVTHNEFRTTRDQRLPVVCLVDAEVMAFKRVFDANGALDSFRAPGMDAPAQTFAFLHEITTAAVNNGVLSFVNVADARGHLKRQLAHMFGEFLRGQFDPVKAEIKDVLAEIKTLRHELAENRGGKSDDKVLLAMRYLLDEDTDMYRSLIRGVLGRSIDHVITDLIESPTFDAAVERITGSPIEVRTALTDKEWQELAAKGSVKREHTFHGYKSSEGFKAGVVIFGVDQSDGHLVINEAGVEELRRQHLRLRLSVTQERPETTSRSGGKVARRTSVVGRTRT